MSNPLIVQDWISTHQCEMSENAIRDLFQPAGHYRISCAKYPVGASFAGASIGGMWFVLSGKCEVKFPDRVRLDAGQFAECPAGEFLFTVLGDREVSLVKVWLLPEGYRSA